jgi:hypothetical protein
MADPDRNVEGATTAITTFSTVRWWGRVWLPVLFAATRRIPRLTAKLRDLSFIHFARWTLIRELPVNGTRGGKLRYPHLFFESNFNGGWNEYIDAFSSKLGRGMTAFWSSSYGFPGPVPTGPFKAYIRSNETVADHYWTAYPGATTTMIERALRLAGWPAPARQSKSTNVNGQAYAFMSMTPVRAGHEDALTTLLRAMDPSLFENLPGTHMGRFVVVRDFHCDPAWGQPFDEHLDDAYLVFTSNFDGPLDTYLAVLGMLPEADAIWGHCVGYPPRPPAAPARRPVAMPPRRGETETLKAYLQHNQIHTGLFYTPYGHATVRDVLAALEALPVEDAPEWASSTLVERVHVAHATRIATDSYDAKHPPGSPRPFKRDQHGDEYGTIHGTLTIDTDQIPADMRHGLLAVSGNHPVTARFSPSAPIPWPLHPPVGIGLKVGVVKNLTARGADGSVTQDFLLAANTDRFFCASAEDAVDLVRAQARGGLPGLGRYFFPSVNPRRWRIVELRVLASTLTQRVTDLLTGTMYYSQVPVMCGPDLVVKVAVRMDGDPPKGGRFKRPDLVARMKERLATGNARFTLLFQPQQPGESADDIRWSWKGPWVPVGEGVFPAQEISDGEALTVTLAHCHPDHVSPGPIPAVRRSVYEAISRRRQPSIDTAPTPTP